jgi:hypothetical protein
LIKEALNYSFVAAKKEEKSSSSHTPCGFGSFMKTEEALSYYFKKLGCVDFTRTKSTLHIEM